MNESPAPVRRIRLLIVDDCVDLGMALQVTLKGHPTVEPVGVIDESESIVSAVGDRRPDVVLLDLTMPGLDPLEALRALRSTGSTVKVIAFSGYDDPETIAHARAAGADDFLSKTTDPSLIADAVERVHSRAATP